jgi:ABC-type transport system substrate-binding protein
MTTRVDRHAKTGAVRRTRLLAAVAALVVVASACSSSTTPNATPGGTTPPANVAAPKDEGTPTPGGTLKVGVAAEIDGLNPVQARWSLDGNLIGSALYDTLLTFDEKRNLVPRLAESVTPNKEGTEWTIKVRSGVTFHDGTPLDAAAVKRNVEARKAQPLTGGALEPIQSVSVTDPQTAVVKMSSPWFGYDYTLAAQGGYMVAPALIDLGAESMKTAIGTGPFKLVGGFTPGQPIKVERNPNYWGDKAFLDGIEFTALADPGARAQALRAHDQDVIFTQDADAIRRFRSTENVKQVEDVDAEEAFAMLNLATPPFDNAHARKALALATDRDGIVESLGATDVKKPADGPYIEGEKYFNPESGYPDFDVEKAKAEVEAYKQETGAASLSFTLIGDPGEQTSMQPLQAMWKDAGVDVSIDVMDQTAFLINMFLGKFQAAMFRNFAYVNPDSNFIFWDSSQAKGVGNGSINFGQLKSPELDKALATARATNDEAARTEQYKRLTPILNASLPYIWLYHNDWALAADSKVGGLNVPLQLGFARQDAKPIWNKIWLQQ